MNIKNYLKEKSLFIGVNIVIATSFIMFLLYIGVEYIWIFGIIIIWFFPMTIYFIADYLKKSEFYNSLCESLAQLDNTYLVGETIEEPEFLEGKIVYDALIRIEENTHNTIKNYENKQFDYKEYIETWIHEIKTPIASTKLIIHNNKNEVTKNIENEVLEIEGLLEQVLYYSKSDDVAKDYIVREVILKDLIKNVLKKNARDFIYKNISLSLENVDNIVFTDIKWIEFMINQILGNAIKYSKKENAKIKIYSKKNENNVVLSIEDNGIGIPKQDIRRVFDKGFTGENGRIYGKSTGMGLYICKRLSDKLGLELELSSKYGEGTKVNIIFPVGKITLMES